MKFVNRIRELAQLHTWARRSGPSIGVVWGRKRVGKTWLVHEFARERRSISYICRPGPHQEQLKALSGRAAGVLSPPRRSIATTPFGSWRDAFDTFVTESASEPLLVVFDEFPELLRSEDRFDRELRALWDEVVLSGANNLKVLLLGSAVGTMEAIQAENAPMYGRLDLRLFVHPFLPHEAALMLSGMEPGEQARAWGVCGGIPRFLGMWETDDDFGANLERLVANPAGVLLSEGELILGDEEVVGHRLQRLPEQVLRTIAAGNTGFAAIKERVSGLPTRTLEHLCTVRLLERVHPVTEDPARTKLSYYRIADNFLAFWLTCVEPHREAIEEGLGPSCLPVIAHEFSDFMGPRYEQAFRQHLRRMATAGTFGVEITDVGEYWRRQEGRYLDPCQFDGVVLQGRRRKVVAVGEAKWADRVNGSSLLGTMVRKLRDSKLADPGETSFVVCARNAVERSRGMIEVTAADIFGE